MAATRKPGVALFALLVLAVPACSPVAADLVTGGAVVEASGGAPVTGATVAVFDDEGEVVGTDITDADGTWAIETEWDHAHLKAPSRGGGLFSSLLGIVTWPVRTTARVVGGSAKVLFKSAARAAGGAAAAGASVAAVAGAGPVAQAAIGQVGRTVGRAASEAVVGKPDDELDDRKPDNDPAPGQVMVRVWKQGQKDYLGPTSVYTLERLRDEKGHDVDVATVDPVLLAVKDSGERSSAPRRYGVFTDVQADPAIAEGGATVRITAIMPLPEEMASSTAMVAWDLTSQQRVQLTRQSGETWEGQMELPRKGPYRNHDLTIVAYRVPNDKGERDEKLEGRIWDKDAWDMEKPYPVDPALLVSRNRGHVIITVTKPPKR